MTTELKWATEYETHVRELINADESCTCTDLAGMGRRNRAGTAIDGSTFTRGYYVTQAKLGAIPHECQA